MRLPTLSPAASTALFAGPFTPAAGAPYGITLAGGGDVPDPMPGCAFVGTECRVGYQTCKYCCGNGQSYTRQCGWCIGWYDAPPCVGF
ncbi:hypothetical protein [uncultured Pseudonocardia sp.]|uniref:hypothetical protein n=1 Tax=uncultured Pseudonocardia sp. TaxID=211455 RepID=UPI0026069EA4|nr:hypothetical protein [uncultured Pseudonocardia sp.]